jgi:hypothetical protein
VAIANADTRLYELKLSDWMLRVTTNYKSACLYIWRRRLEVQEPHAIRRLGNKDVATGIQMNDCHVVEN